MSKVIKLKQSDLTNIVLNIVEQIEEDLSTDVQTEEGAENSGEELALGKDPKTGREYVIKNPMGPNPELIYKS